jgi:hypothetical protein
MRVGSERSGEFEDFRRGVKADFELLGGDCVGQRGGFGR